MQIRLAKTSDFDEICACEALAFQMSSRRDKSRIFSHGDTLAAQIREGQIHVIYEAKRILGYISFLPSSNHVFVETLAVLPRNHRKGLGSRLLAHAEKAALALGMRSVKLFTDGNVAGNLLFYQHQGYRETDRCEDNDFSRVFYSKALAS